MLEKNYKLAEMIFLEQVMGEEAPDRREVQREENATQTWGGKCTGQLSFHRFGENF